MVSPADARQIGGVHVGGGHAVYRAPGESAYRATVNRNRSISSNINRGKSPNVTINRNVNVNRKYAYRNGQRGYWRNGVWIVAPLAGAAYGYGGSSCNYLYNQWQQTNSVYWRDRYRRCANGN
jgi:hypothetical protein